MRCLCGFILLFWLPLTVLAGGMLAEAEVKAGFIYNFAKFVTWPNLTSTEDIRVCSVGESPLTTQLSLLQGREAQGRKIRVSLAKDAASWRACHLLYIAPSEVQRLTTILAAVAQNPVLTVSDSAGFVEAGGNIGLQLLSNRVRFSINLVAARQAGLQLSSQLLQLAYEVIQ